MTGKLTYQKIRLVIIVISLTVGTGVFWTFLLAEGIRYLFNLNENRTLLYFGVPFFLAYSVWCARKLPEMLRKAGYIE